MTGTPEHRGDPATEAVVIGGGVLACELVHALLRKSGVRTSDAGGATADAAATVLVDPAPSHWDEARVLALPIVLVSVEQLASRDIVGAVVQGADAVLHGDSDPRELGDAIRAVAAGGTVLPPPDVRALADAMRAHAGRKEPALHLTGRETDILASIDRGETIKQTARTLGISRKTVENLQTRLFRKLGVRNRAQAVARAHALGLFLDPSSAVDVDVSVDVNGAVDVNSGGDPATSAPAAIHLVG